MIRIEMLLKKVKISRGLLLKSSQLLSHFNSFRIAYPIIGAIIVRSSQAIRNGFSESTSD